MFFYNVSYLKEGFSHLYTQSLGLIASGYSTSVIVGKDNDRLPAQIRPEDPLAGCKEIVAISQSEHSYIFFITYVTTPQTMKSFSAVTSIGR